MHNSTSRPLPTSPVVRGIATYRWAIAWRSLLAIFGGYLLAAASAAWLGRLLPMLGMARLDAVAGATMLGFIVHACAAIWVFAVAGTRRATIGILLPAALLAASVWWPGAAA